MGLRAGRKMYWDALVWQRRPGNRKRKVHKSQSLSLCIDDAPD